MGPIAPSPTLEITEADAGATLHVDRGEHFKIKCKEDEGKLTWISVSGNAVRLYAVDEEGYFIKTPTYHFDALKEGRSVITLSPGGSTLKKVIYTIIVDPFKQ